MKTHNATNAPLAAALALVFGTLVASAALAEEIKPGHEVSFNVAVASDYRFRGLSQTRLKPALQGGADYTNKPTGLYAGTWLSTIKWTKDAGGGGDIEWDIYGGKRGEIIKDVSYDVGALAYVYPSNGLATSANTFELYGQVGYGPAYVKYSHSTTNLFGFPDSKNSGYLDLGANIEVMAGTVLNLHVGRQRVKGTTGASYTDYKVGVTHDLGVCSVALAIIGADTSYYVGPAPALKNLGKTRLVLSVAKTF